MPKTRVQKEQLLAELKDKLSKMQSVVLTSFCHLKSRALFELRDNLSAQGIDYKVVKNNLLKIALASQKLTIPDEILDQPLALAFSYQDEVEPAKIIYQFAQNNEGFRILGGLINGQFNQPEQIRALALLPSRKELYCRLINSLNFPRHFLLYVLTFNQRKLTQILRGFERSIQND